MTTKEQVNNAKEMYYQSLRNYLDTAKKAVAEQRGFYLKDVDSDEDGQPVRIHTSNLDHNYEYFPSFDQVNFRVELFGKERMVFIFHVVEGDDLFPDNTWVSEDDLSEDNLMELLNYIKWDI